MPNSSGKPGFANAHDALYDALSSNSIPGDADLVELLQAWPTLTPTVRAGILKIVRQEAGK